MTPPESSNTPTPTGSGDDEVARIQADLEQTRQRLGDTVEALTAKLDVKTRAQHRAAQVREEHGTQVAIAAGTVAVLLVALVVWRRSR